MRYDATELTQTAVLNDTPNGASGGIWMDGTGAALDADGNMFVSTGNGTFDDTNNVVPPLAPNNDFGETFLNVNPTTLAVQDFYAPSQTTTWSEEDLDLASAGVTVLPDGVGPTAHPNVLIGSDKSGHLYMIDRNNMSGYFSSADNMVQYLTLPGASVCFNADQQCVYSAPGYWNGTVYVGDEDGPLMAFELSSGLIPATAQQVRGPYIAERRDLRFSGSDAGHLGLTHRRRHRLGAGQPCERHQQRQLRDGSGDSASLRRHQPRYHAVLELSAAGGHGRNRFQICPARGGQRPCLHRRHRRLDRLRRGPSTTGPNAILL